MMPSPDEKDAIRFYCGLSHKYWSAHLCDPGPYACISPIVRHGDKDGFVAHSGVYVPDGVQVLQDSGAFGEPMSAGRAARLSFADALKRQQAHAARYDYAHKIAYQASYDLLVDHRLSEAAYLSGAFRRSILRCAESDGEEAVEVTIRAARFLDQHRHHDGYPLALNVQGVTPEQYLRCVQAVVPLLRGGDMLGLGGWCVLGRLPRMMGDFLQTLALVMPFLARESVSRVHLYGCIYTPALAAALAMCDQYGIMLSNDSAFPSFGPRVGKWGYGSWRERRYVRPHVCLSAAHCAGMSRCLGRDCIRHVRLTRAWLAHFSQREPSLYRLYARNLDQYQYGQVLDLDLSLSDVPQHERVRVVWYDEDEDEHEDGCVTREELVFDESW